MHSQTNRIESKLVEFTRIKNDVNGNPRYVCHFLTLNTEEELNASGEAWIGISEKYNIACKRANKIGGKKYYTKAYGGGIVFQSYNLDCEVREINKLTGKHYDGYVCN